MANAELRPLTLFAYRTRSGEKAHFATGTNSPTLCSLLGNSSQTTGEPIMSHSISMRGGLMDVVYDDDRIVVCFNCQKALRVLKRAAAL